MQPVQLATLMRASLALALLLAAAATADLADACACGKMFDPVCGSDGRTYANPCTLRCTRDSEGRELAEVHAGHCQDSLQFKAPAAVEVPAPARPPRHSCVCPQIWRPVCGTDDRTYSNPCDLNCARMRSDSSKGADLAVAHSGPCADASPMADGVVFHAPPPAAPTDEAALACPCARILLPVCGTDGRTYSNLCLLNCASKARGGAIRVAHEGRC